MKPSFKVLKVRSSFDKPQVSWNGKGKHPVLNMTREEILAANEAVMNNHHGTRADSTEKVVQPEFTEEVKLAQQDAEYKKSIFVENMADALSKKE